MPDQPYSLRRGLYVVGQGIRQAKGTFAVAVAGSALYGVMTAGQAWALGRVTAQVVEPAFRAGHVTGAQLLQAAGLLALVTLLLVIGVVVRRVAAGRASFDLGALYRRRVTAQYLRLPLSWHHRHPAGQLLSNANADVEATWNVFAPLPMALGVVVMLVVGAVAMLLADPVLALIGLLVFPLLLVANLLFQRRMSPLVTRAQGLRAEVSAVAHESFDGALVVKAMGRETAETDRFAAAAGRLRDANVEVGRLRGVFDPVIEAIPTLGTLAVLGVGAARVAAGSTSAADVVQVAYLFALLAFPVRAIGWVLAELPRSVVGWDRVDAVVTARGGMAYGGAQPAPEGAAAVATRAASYAYDLTGDGTPEGRHEVLHDVTVDVAPGSTVAVVGPTGSGKSTLASLLVRLVDPDSGQVLLDAQDVRDLDRGGLPSVAALVPQQTFMFDDTVRGNVTLGDPRAEAGGDDAVWAALQVAQGEAFVRALPHGLDTRIGERGATLSGGQRQRIALARALVRSPRLLVMDDATSAVDPRVEAAILAALRDSGEGTTVVVVAYRKATIALADEVVYVEQGRVVGRGSHEQLLATVPGYERLVTAYEREAAERAALAADEERAVAAREAEEEVAAERAAVAAVAVDEERVAEHAAAAHDEPARDEPADEEAQERVR